MVDDELLECVHGSDGNCELDGVGVDADGNHLDQRLTDAQLCCDLMNQLCDDDRGRVHCDINVLC